MLFALKGEIHVFIILQQSCGDRFLPLLFPKLFFFLNFMYWVALNQCRGCIYSSPKVFVWWVLSGCT